jgi:hypothetical protein
MCLASYFFLGAAVNEVARASAVLVGGNLFAICFREGSRRVDNGAQVLALRKLAHHRGPSMDFGGYYQRRGKQD